MHGLDKFARMPAGSTAGQPSLDEQLHIFDLEREVTFKDEIYLVRDNGAVFRRACPQTRRRPLDEVWTFGTRNRHSGYFEIAGVVIHRIVATAFHGPGPTVNHVVDHIDTNRLNNRAENLRWATRLENILLNPTTRARIVIAFGSLEAFFENPGACSIPNWDWMRVVTKEEAQECRKRLEKWAQTPKAGKGGSLGEWLFEPMRQPSPPAGQDSGSQDVALVSAAQGEAYDKPSFESAIVKGEALRHRGAAVMLPPGPDSLDTPSLTASAFQRMWRTPTEFPQCPAAISEGELAGYWARLISGAVFARNRYGESTVVEAAISTDGVLSVVCNSPSGIKDWSHAKVYVESEGFCHESGETYFTWEGAMKAHCIAIGAPSDEYEGSIDDYC